MAWYALGLKSLDWWNQEDHGISGDTSHIRAEAPPRKGGPCPDFFRGVKER